MDLFALHDRLTQLETKLAGLRAGPYGYIRYSRMNDRMMPKIKLLKHKIGLRLADRAARAREDTRGEKRKSKAQQIIRARSLWNTQATIMAFDVERTPEGVLHEVGVTLIRGRRPLESFNYRVRGISRGPKFIFGQTIVADYETIRNLVRIHAASAKCYVGHSVGFDFKHLEAEGVILPSRVVYDTAKWAHIDRGRTPSLFELTREYGVGSTQMHCGGNDARYTAGVFLKMIGEDL